MGRLRMMTPGAVVGDFTADSPTLHVDSTNDRVGISTATPAVPLDVIGIAAFTTADGDNTQGVIRVGRDSGGAAGGELVWNTADYVGLRCSDSGALSLVVDPSGNTGLGVVAPKTRLTVEGAVTLKEQASADADTVAYGQLWVRDVAPCELYFTTDAGDDIQLTSGTAVAGGGGSSDTDTSTALSIELWMT